jgi:hypothetical protein
MVASRLSWWERCVARPRVAVDYLTRVYRYRPFEIADLDPKAPGYLADLVTTGTLFVPTALTFNDPWEAGPNFQPVPWRTDRDREVAEFLAFLTPDLNTVQHRAHLTEQVRHFSPEAVLREGQRILRERLLQIPIISLSDRPDNFLMWSYYARGHNGYALVFDARCLPFAGAVKVRYSRRHPRVFLNTRDMMGLSVRVLATKARQWRHEGEWRVIAPAGATERIGLHGMRRHSERGHHAQIARNSLLAVIVGDQLYKSSHGPDVLKLLREAAVPAMLAEINRRAFKIDLRSI